MFAIYISQGFILDISTNTRKQYSFKQCRCNLCVGNNYESIMTHSLSTHRRITRIWGVFIVPNNSDSYLSFVLHNTNLMPQLTDMQCRKKQIKCISEFYFFTFTGHKSYYACLPLHVCMVGRSYFSGLHLQYRLYHCHCLTVCH